MKNKNKRILWLINHTTLREFEVPLLLSLGFEVYTPKYFPIDEANLSASVTYDYDKTLSIPKTVLDTLNAHDFYSEPITIKIQKLLNSYFNTAIFAFFPHLFREFVRSFHGNLLLRVFGLAGTTTYTKVIEKTFDKNFHRALNNVEKRFWFAQAYECLAEIEEGLFKRRALNLPLGLPESCFQNRNTWVGDEKCLLFVCPRIASPIKYYGKIYRKFKSVFGHFPHIIAGNQPIFVNDSSVVGFQPREQFNTWLTHCQVMFYHSQEPRHLHYHPLEAIVFGMPLIYMRGGMLEKLGGIKQPGACSTFREARIKVEKILNNDEIFIRDILENQTKILEKFELSTVQTIWKENFVEKMTILQKGKTSHKKLTIGVFLPIPYLGGSLRGAKNVAKMLKLGSQANDYSVNVVFSCVANTYNVENEFSDLIEMGISVRETQWRPITREELELIGAFDDVPLCAKNASYLLPTDGICNFNDCDFWLLVSDRTFPALAPIKPYAAIIYDYIQRYLPGMTSTYHKEYSFIEEQRMATARNARFVMVTTPQTREDAIQYVGLNPNKVILMPLEFSILGEVSQYLPKNTYFIWTTNLSPHKNHLNAFKALEIYYEVYRGQFNVIVTGVDTELFNFNQTSTSPYIREVKAYLENSSLLKEKIHFLGNLSGTSYLQTLSHAQFLWHPTRIDNGTFSVIEAAYYQVPSLSSDYPQMRYIDERFKLNLLFSDPLSSQDMAQKLSFMECNSEARKALLPDKTYLGQFTYQKLAPQFWQIIKDWL